MNMIQRALRTYSHHYDLERRLEMNATGPVVHVTYYQQDSADALVEIRRLRKLVAFLASGKPVTPVE